PPISGLSLEEKPITLYSGSVKPLRVLHHRWRVQRVLNQNTGRCQRREGALCILDSASNSSP
ncbi:MAG: hypothetical protein ACYTKD_27830, partial [Planctomycetota bacterium]